MKPKYLILASFFYLNFTFLSYSQESGNENLPNEDALAKQLQNPISSLISVPIQGNMDFGIGPNNGTRFTLNMQPVIPVSISEHWNLVTRLILPFISQSDVYLNSSQTGLGDAVVSGFFSPKKPSKGGLIWGAGPVVLFPSATDNLLGAHKFGIGPTAVALKQSGSLTFGVLVNHIWSVAGNNDYQDINTTFIQPFIAKNFNDGYAINMNTELSQSWDYNATFGTLNITGSKMVSFGSLLSQLFIGPRIPYGNANAAEWGIRGGVIFLFPKKG